jgi:hypothetical protein
VDLLLLADTHAPKRARHLPARVWDEVARADAVLHAGDWVELALRTYMTATTAAGALTEVVLHRLVD